MSLATEVVNLTTAVDSIESAVKAAKPALDEREVLGRGHKTTAKSHENNAKGFRDDVEAYKETAYDALRDVKSIAEQNLSSATKDLTKNAVDVFVYDTSKDSDGGAWRNRTQHTSWYNEQLGTATRGYRKEFPSVAVIVTDGDELIIYDGDDPSMPMWFTHTIGGGVRFATDGYGFDISTLTARDGKIFVGLQQEASHELGAYGGVLVFDYVADTTEKYAGTGGGSNRGVRDGVRFTAWGGYMNIVENDNKLVHGEVNDVAVTVLDAAPIDPKTKLPVPTIAVGTEGGVSVIKDDGNIFDITGTNWGSKCDAVTFNDDGILFFAQERYYLVSCDVKGLTEDLTGLQDGRGYYKFGLDDYPLKQVSGNNYIGFNLDKGIAASSNDDFYVAYSMYNYYPHQRLVLSTEGNKNHRYAGDSQMSAYITDTYNTGWMHGDIKLATLASTTAETFSPPEMITNGTFNSDINGWSADDYRWDGSGAVERYQGNTNSSVTQNINIVKGEVYKVEYDVTHTGGYSQTNVFIDTGSGNITLGNTFGSAHVVDYFRAERTKTMQFRLFGISDFRGTFDNVSVKRVEPNLVNKAQRPARAGLEVVGSVTKSAVATGAELVSYDLGGASAYLSKSNFDFPHYDCSVMFWVGDSGSDRNVLFLGDPTNNNPANGVNIWVYGSRVKSYWGSQYVYGVNGELDGGRHFVCFVRKGDTVSLYVDGKYVSKNDVPITNAITDTDLAIGKGYYANGQGCTDLALLRISATAPTAEQIAKIYRDEKPLFQEGAKCTLHESDAVGALDYDKDEKVLHVGTSDGTSVFSGLQRIEHTTHAVTVALSASNGLVIEE